MSTATQTLTTFTAADVSRALDLGDNMLAKRLLQLATSGVPAQDVTPTPIAVVTEEPRRGRQSRSGGNHPMVGQVLAWLSKAPDYITASLVEETFPNLGGTYQVNAILDWMEEQKVVGPGERAKGRQVLVRNLSQLHALAANSQSSEIVAIPEGEGAKRSRADLLAIRTRLLDFVVHNEGRRIEEASTALGCETRAITGPMKHLIGEKLVRTEGERRGTKYFATTKGKGSIESTAIVSADEEAKPAKKRARKPAKKKASSKKSNGKKAGSSGSKKAKSGGSKKAKKAAKPAAKSEAPKAEGKLPEASTSASV